MISVHEQEFNRLLLIVGSCAFIAGVVVGVALYGIVTGGAS